MPTTQNYIAEFHRAFDVPIYGAPAAPDPGRIQLRMDLIDEEVEEVHQEMALFRRRGADAVFDRRAALARVAKELADLVYVTYGAAAEFGIDLDSVVAEVHESNMSKLDLDGNPIIREDGKILKGPLYWEPDIETVLHG